MHEVRNRIAEALFLRVMGSEAALAIMAPVEMAGLRSDFNTEKVQRIAERSLIAAHLFVHVCEVAEASFVDTFAKCDGNHGGPACADPECWHT